MFRDVHTDALPTEEGRNPTLDSSAIENIDANEEGTEVKIGFAEWQTIQAVQMLLARYGRAIAEPQEKV